VDHSGPRTALVQSDNTIRPNNDVFEFYAIMPVRPIPTAAIPAISLLISSHITICFGQGVHINPISPCNVLRAR
jgi:hypothetical protein